MDNTASLDAFTAIQCRFLLENPTLGRLLLGMPRLAVPTGTGVWWQPQANGVLALAWGSSELALLPPNQQNGWLQRAAWHFLLHHFPLPESSGQAAVAVQLATDLVVSQGIARADWPPVLPHWQHWSVWAQAQGLAWVPGQSYRAYLPLVQAWLAQNQSVPAIELATRLEAALPIYHQWQQEWLVMPPFFFALFAIFWKNSCVRIRPLLEQAPVATPQMELLLRLLPNTASIQVVRPWQQALQQLVGRAQATRLRPTLRRASRRYGTVPGLQLQRLRRLAVVVDTSGSVSAELVHAFFAEIKDLWRRGVELVVVECDDRVRRTYPYRGQPPTTAAGGGNTNFDPALIWCNQAERLDGVVYFTDGQADPPCIASRRPLLWVVALAPGQVHPRLPGRVAIWPYFLASEKSEKAEQHA